MNCHEKVHHNYSDRSGEPDPSPQEGGRVVPLGMDHNFPTKLHYMLSTIEEDGQSNVVSWQPHGRCFMVHDMAEFVNSMLPLWFRQSKFASFQRQLNLYGFQRLTQGRDKNAYYHEYFLRGRPLLAQKITRTKVKGKGARKASSPETEPRLYDLPWMKETKKAVKVQVVNGGDQATVAATFTSSNATHRVSPTLAVLAANLAPAPQPLVLAGTAPTSSSAPQPSPAVLAGAMTALANPPRSLGDALGFLGALTIPNQATTPLPGGETMFLPSPAPSNQASLNSLLSSLEPVAPVPAASSAPMYVPIAPAPLAPQGGEPFKPPIQTNNNYSSVLAALKVQHCAVPLASSQAVRGPFTTPGPTPFKQ